MNGPDDIRRSLGRLALAFAFLGFGSLALGLGLAVLGLLGGAVLLFGSSAGGAVGLSALCLVVGVVLAAGGIPELLAWYGISKRAAWGRWLGIVLCTTMLAAFPLGTAFGAWGLWMLLSSAGVLAFGLQRSWLGDAAALAVGWFFMPDDDDARSYRVDRRGRRRRRGRHGGFGALLFLLLFLGVLAFATCGSCWQSFASGVSSGASPSVGAGNAGDPAGMSFGAPATLGAKAGSWLREAGALDAATGAGAAPPDAVAPSLPSPPPPPPPTSPPGPTAPTSSAASTPEPDRRGTGQLWIFDDERGETHIVDDVEKIPEALRAKARPFR